MSTGEDEDDGEVEPGGTGCCGCLFGPKKRSAPKGTPMQAPPTFGSTRACPCVRMCAQMANLEQIALEKAEGVKERAASMKEGVKGRAASVKEGTVACVWKLKK